MCIKPSLEEKMFLDHYQSSKTWKLAVQTFASYKRSTSLLNVRYEKIIEEVQFTRHLDFKNSYPKLPIQTKPMNNEGHENRVKNIPTQRRTNRVAGLDQQY
jgi:hypothetical protein